MSNTLSKEDENELKAYMDEYHKHAVATEIAKLEQYIAYKAQQEAIGFVEWILSEQLQYDYHDEQWCHSSGEGYVETTEKLFQTYLKSKEK